VAITWANLKTQFYGTIGDVEGTNTFFSTAQVLQWANDCLREIGERTHFYDLEYSNAGTAGDPYISFTTYNVFSVWRVEVDEEVVRPITADKLRHGDKFWEQRSGVPRWYIIDEYQTDLDEVRIRLYETPPDDYNIVVYMYSAPLQPSDSNPTYNIHLPEWFAYSLTFGMLAKAYAAETQMRNFEIAAFYNSIYEDAILRLRARSNSRLKNEWEYQPSSQDTGFTIWNRIPATITGP
jgi:hypothetical protein